MMINDAGIGREIVLLLCGLLSLGFVLGHRVGRWNERRRRLPRVGRHSWAWEWAEILIHTRDDLPGAIARACDPSLPAHWVRHAEKLATHAGRAARRLDREPLDEGGQILKGGSRGMA